MNIDSSVIKAAEYTNGIMTLTFNHGGVYQYTVDVGTWNRFINAESKGQFFNHNIRNIVEARRLR